MREPNAEPIPGYRLIEPLGCGGFGEVWKCEAPGGLFKAIKFVFGNLNSLDVDGARAEQELHALNRVKEVRHPFVLSMDRIEIVEGELVIVMELADRSLHDLFQECISAGLVGIPREALLCYIRDAAEALDHMNEKHNLQHLDIKPRNLFLISDRVKVADFGLVKHLERSGASGLLGGVTPLYAPPETFSGTISGRSDQYSLAVVYQELLTGHRPFNGKNARRLAQQHMNEQPELRSLPEGERPVVARALSKDPGKRFPNCLAFVRALYTARLPARLDLPHAESTGPNGIRSPSISDTMENMLLEQLPDEGGLPAFAAGSEDDRNGDGSDEVSRLGVTIAQPQTGALRPTVVIGIGSFGRRALQELRCRFLDRFGDLDKVSLVRFLYLDADGDAVKAATRGAPEVALRPSEIHHLPLQPISHYRRRQLDQLSEWLPREKLFTMPRSLKTQGSRALGRLAFTDNYLRVIARLRREIQTACHPDSIYHTVSQTGLALRDNVPRIYVIGCASGGGSGFFVDLGYSLRRLLNQLHQPEALVTSFLFCGAPDDPATPPAELANLYATLTELNHFSDPAVPFTAQYGSDGPRLIDQGSAYDNSYLVTLTHRTPEARRDAMAHLGSYLFHELTTPLSTRLEQVRRSRNVLPFRSFGTYAVWFPRGLLLHLAARVACQRLLEKWQATTLDEYAIIPDKHAAPPLDNSPSSNGLDDQVRVTAHDLLDAAQARVLADSELQPDALANRILELAAHQLEGSPRELLTRLLAAIEEQSQQMVAQDDPGAWARQALTRVQDWLGGGVQPPGTTSLGPQRKSRLTRALENAATKLAEEWDQRFGAAAYGLMEHPGHRIALAEAALNRFLKYCHDATKAHQQRLQQQAAKSQQSQKQLQNAVDNCIEGTGGFSWFGGRSRRLLRVFVDHLAAFSRQCLAEDTLSAVQSFYGFLQGRINDRLRDLSFCRQRLRHMQESLAETGGEDGTALQLPLDEIAAAAALNGGLDYSPTPVKSAESFWESIRESATARVVLPDGVQNLEQGARRFLETLTQEQWTQLDQVIQDQVLATRDGLHKALMGTTDLMRHLLAPLISQAVSCLSNHLPITDVAQVELAVEGKAESSLGELIQKYYALAAPALRHKPSKKRSGVLSVVTAGGGGDDAPPVGGEANAGKDRCFLLVPASEAGKRYGEQSQGFLPDVQLVNVPGQADLMFCREQPELSLEDLDRILRACRQAYEEAAHVPQSSPHARFDIQDWMPLDP
jgi:serine/threonine protein kinase